MAKYRFEQIAINCKEKAKAEDIDISSYIGLEHLESGSLYVSSWGSAVPIKGDKIVMHAGDVLFGKRNAYLRRAAIAPHDGAFSAHGMIFRPREDVVDKDFFPLFIASDYFFDTAIRISVGSLSPTVNWRDLKNQEFELPDLAVQRRLAEVLWSINDTMEAYKKLISATDELVKSQFMEQFGSREKGCYCTLEECCVSVTGGSTPSMKREDYYGGDVPFIKSGDVKADYVSSGALWLTQRALDETTARYVPTGTVIVVTRSGILKHNLPVAITENPVVINQDLKAFEPKTEFLPQYLAWAIRSKEDVLLSKTRAMTVDNIESRELYEIPVMIVNIEEQEQFAAFVRQSDKSKFELEKALAELTATYKRIIAENLG